MNSPSSFTHPLPISTDLAQEILSVIETGLRAAGALLLNDFYLPHGPRGSGSHAEADAEAETLIRDTIRDVFPHHDIIGEERSGDRHPTSPFQWQLDPNDGTSSYLKGYRGSSISIGLLYEGEPVAGGVFAYAYPNDRGDLIMGGLPHPFGGVTRNGIPCPRPSKVKRPQDVLVAISQNADRSSEINITQVAPGRYLSIPSIAYRLALAAVDEVQAGVSIAGPTTWDLAGAHALLRAQGRELYTWRGEVYRYRSEIRSSEKIIQQPSPSGPGVLVGGDPLLCAQLLKENLNKPRRDQDPSQTRRPYPLHVPQRAKAAIAEGDVLERAQGALLGMMSGDALGSLVEFQSAHTIAQRYPEGVRVMKDGGTFDKIAGQVTDDSEMAIALARSILKAGTYHPDEAAVAYAEWRGSHPFDIGNTTRAALDPAWSALYNGASSADVASAARENTLSTSEANGALMRITPLAIWGAGQADLSDDDLADLARLDATITHAHRVCQDANAVYVVALRYALLSPRTPREVYDYARSWAARQTLEASVLERLVLAEREPPTSGKGWVLNALQAAFYALLHHSCAEGISWSISIGADTDTNAAITGGLLGATHGLSSLPPSWVSAVITSRPHRNLGRGRCQRPKWLWSCDALLVAEALLH